MKSNMQCFWRKMLAFKSIFRLSFLSISSYALFHIEWMLVLDVYSQITSAPDTNTRAAHCLHNDYTMIKRVPRQSNWTRVYMSIALTSDGRKSRHPCQCYFSILILTSNRRHRTYTAVYICVKGVTGDTRPCQA